MKDTSSIIKIFQQKNERNSENYFKQLNLHLKETKGNINISSKREKEEKFSIKKENPKKINRKYLMILIVFVAFNIISIVLFILIRLIKKNNEGYSFNAIYRSRIGEKIKLFNPISINMNESEYKVFLSNGNSTLRNFEEIESNYGEINSTKNGFIKIIVNFTKALSNLDFMFEGCEDLISVNLSQINSPSLQSSIYTFTNCKNLKQADLSLIDTSKVTSMDFLFSGCNNLVKIIGLEKLNTSSVKKTAGMFFECEKLRHVNLSAFKLDKIEESSGMFINNPSLEAVDLGDCSDINQVLQIFSSEINNTGITIYSKIDPDIIHEVFNISVTIEETFNSAGCYTGNESTCLNCREDRPNICENCKEGYYLPSIASSECDSCTEGCKNCSLIEEISNSICEVCKDGYNIFKGYCIKNCEIGKNEKCLECKTEEGKNNECLKCNDGYYLSEINKTICKKNAKMAISVAAITAIAITITGAV